MRASWGTATPNQGDRVFGAIVIAADVAVWAVLVPGRALFEMLPG